MRKLSLCGIVAVVLGLAAGVFWMGAAGRQARVYAKDGQKASAPAAGLRFEVSFPAAVHAGPITGRVFVMVSRDISRCGGRRRAASAPCEPRLQVSRTGVPFFGRDVEGLKPGGVAVIDGTDLGSPLEHLSDLPAGDYYVQAMLNVYSEFKRADGHTVWMHDDQWEGQHWQRGPGNLYSTVQKMHVDPASGVIKLVRTRWCLR